jgi:parvulin-like peptidyl-prolyl isomerase
MMISFLTIFVILMSIIGCGKQNGHVVAKVGDRKIMLEEVTRYFDRAGVQFISAEMEIQTKRDMLDSLVNQNLLIIGAYESNLENQEEVLSVIEGEKGKFLLDVLFEKVILSKIEPSEAEIKEWYTRSNEEINANHILVDSLSVAEEVLQKLKDGAVFEELAVEYSIDPSAKRNQGDLGWFTWGTMVDNFQEAAFSMQPGDVSAPVKTQFGYHIIKVVDRRELERRPSYEEAKGQIQNMISERRKRTLMQEYAENLEKQYPITVENPTCDFLLNKLEFLYPDTIGGRPRWRNNIDPAQLDQEEKSLVLGSYDGGQLSIGDYLNNIRRVPEDKRPDFDNFEELGKVIFQMSFMDILNLEAKKMGLEDSEEYKEKLRRFMELAMADVMRNDSIPYAVEIDEGEVQEYYDSHPEDFTTPLRFHLLEIQVADEAMAQKYVSTIRTENEFKKTAGNVTLRPGKKAVSGDLGIILDRQYPELFKAANELKQGHVAGPVSAGGKFSVIWVKERHEAELQEIDVSRRRIIDNLTKEKGDALYREWIENMKKRFPVEVFENVLLESIDTEKYNEPDSVQSG